MSSEDIRRWIESRRATELRERQEVRRAAEFVPSPISAALDLIALWGTIHGWPVPEDPVSRRENEEARERWDLLRRRYNGSR